MSDFLHKVYGLLKHWGKGPVFVACGLLVPPFVVALIAAKDMGEAGGIFGVGLAVMIAVTELIFNFVYRLVFGIPYKVIERIRFEDMYIEPHPYIPYIYKARAMSQRGGKAIYPLHNEKFDFGQYRTNNFRFNNGPKGDRDIIVPKPENLIRVNCIGASTTGNYLEYEGEVYSYPILLEKHLNHAMGGGVEVNNCGQGGYNSADIFVRFALQVIDTEPDVVVIYHAYNDIRSYLTSHFVSDYSHSRRNLGDTYWKFAIAGRMPNIKLGFLNFLFNIWLPGNIRYSLVDQISKGEMSLENDPSDGLRTYRRNLKHIIDLCKANGIRVVLSTYCHFLHVSIADSEIHQLYGRIVERENKIVRSLAQECAIPLVDNAVLVPKDVEYFVDSVHFTPAGMNLIAENIASEVVSVLRGSA